MTVSSVSAVARCRNEKRLRTRRRPQVEVSVHGTGGPITRPAPDHLRRAHHRAGSHIEKHCCDRSHSTCLAGSRLAEKATHGSSSSASHRALLLEAGADGNRTHLERCSHPTQVLKTRAGTSRANTPKTDKTIVRPAGPRESRASEDPRAFGLRGRDRDICSHREPFRVPPPTSTRQANDKQTCVDNCLEERLRHCRQWETEPIQHAPANRAE